MDTTTINNGLLSIIRHSKVFAFTVLFAFVLSLDIREVSANPLDPSGSNIYRLGIKYDNGNLTLNNISIKVGIAPDRKIHPETGYSCMMISSSGDNLYSFKFEVFNKISIPMDPIRGVHPPPIQLEQLDFILIVPYFENVDSINIYNPNGTIALTVNVSNENPHSSLSISSTGSCTTILDNGNFSNKYDIVFIGDDYNDSQLNKFISDVNVNKNKLFSTSPFNGTECRFNIHRVDTFTDFGCYYNCSGIDRLICCNDSKVTNAASVCAYDKIVVIVNNNKYGGSSGSYVVASTNSSWGTHIFVHEFGHIFGGLADEYSYDAISNGDPYGLGNPPNCDSNNTCSKWNGTSGTGCYQTCAYTDWYRSTNNSCLMRDLNINPFQFCLVCNGRLTSLLNNYRDTTAPIISNPYPAGCTKNASVTIFITTDDNATCKYDISDKSYDTMSNTFSTMGRVNHSQNLGNLTSSNKTYYVRCNDSCGNINNVSTVINFIIDINQTDMDNDAIGNVCDPCPSDRNNDVDGDGYCAGSGFTAPKIGGNDNCPEVNNSNQLNWDNDSYGDACDQDSDNDSVWEWGSLITDNCWFTPLGESVDRYGCSCSQIDSDGDGVSNCPDNCPNVANSNQSNRDNDSYGDACDFPDLVVTALNFNKINLTGGENVTINLTVRNIGTDPANNVLIKVYAVNKDVNSVIYNGTGSVNLSNNSDVVIQFNWTVVVGIKITAKADPNNTIIEFDEGNNEKSKTVFRTCDLNKDGINLNLI